MSIQFNPKSILTKIKSCLTFILLFFEVFFGTILLILVLNFYCYFLSNKTHKIDINSNQTAQFWLKSNGEHTDIIIKKSNYLKWSKSLKNSNFKCDSLKFIAIGWGELNFFLKTKNWSDLTVGTLFKALLHLGQPALHFVEMDRFDSYGYTGLIEVNCSSTQLKTLIHSIDKTFLLRGKKVHEIKTNLYDKNNHFYLSEGSYGLLYTCNTWTNDRLTEAQFPGSIWTLFPTGILRWYKK